MVKQPTDAPAPEDTTEETPAVTSEQPAPAPEAPTAVPEAEVAATAPSEPEAPTEAVAATETSPEIPPAGDKTGNAAKEELARLKAEAKATAEAKAQAAVDPTPAEEAAPQVVNSATSIDGSGILTQTNDDVIANFPKNDQGQVVIDSEGRIVGLNDADQPSQPSGSAV